MSAEPRRIGRSEFPTEGDVRFVIDGAEGEEIGEIWVILPGIPRVGDEIVDDFPDHRQENRRWKVTRVVWDLQHHRRRQLQRFWPATVHLEPIELGESERMDERDLRRA